jgi:uncharacterized coiled-coil DUF342 family protein
MEKQMKMIKKYWAILVGAIIAIIGIFAVTSRRNSDKKSDKLKKQIDDNTQQVNQLQGKVDVIEEQRESVKTEIEQHEQTIEELKHKKENIVVEEAKTVQAAKENILNKTRRGRKPKKK